MAIRTVEEGARGCGFRKPGGLYLVSGAFLEPCSRLPVPVDTCPTCGAGIRPARGWTWVEPVALGWLEEHQPRRHSESCPFGSPEALSGEPRHGLIWIGEVFYPDPDSFMAEARRMGVSRRIHNVPRGFEPGVTWVYLAHRKAVVDTGPELTLGTVVSYRPGLFSAFRPTRIEYVVRPGEEDDEELLESYRARGIEPVKVIPVGPGAEEALGLGLDGQEGP